MQGAWCELTARQKRKEGIEAAPLLSAQIKSKEVEAKFHTHIKFKPERDICAVNSEDKRSGPSYKVWLGSRLIRLISRTIRVKKIFLGKVNLREKVTEANQVDFPWRSAESGIAGRLQQNPI